MSVLTKEIVYLIIKRNPRIAVLPVPGMNLGKITRGRNTYTKNTQEKIPEEIITHRKNTQGNNRYNIVYQLNICFYYLYYKIKFYIYT